MLGSNFTLALARALAQNRYVKLYLILKNRLCLNSLRYQGGDALATLIRSPDYNERNEWILGKGTGKGKGRGEVTAPHLGIT